MLRTSRSSKSLQRRKSTQKAQEKPDPAIARQHAQAAAKLAYNRAQQGSSADAGYSHGLSTRESFDIQKAPAENGRLLTGLAEINTNTINQPGDEKRLRHRQSVRFTGPNAVQNRRIVASRAQKEPFPKAIATHSSSASLHRPRALTNDDAVPAEFRPPSRSSSIGKTGLSTQTQNYLTALEAYDEYYTNEDDIASIPSSYRRVRRSKSMNSDIKACNVVFDNGTPARSMDSSRNSVTLEPPRLTNADRLRNSRSMTFFRNLPNRHHKSNNDAAVQIARDKFLHTVEQQRLNSQPSIMFRSRSQRKEKTFLKSVRSTSGGYGLPVMSANSIPGGDKDKKDLNIRDRARKVSNTLRKKLKGLFKMGAEEEKEEARLPIQQVEAARDHGCYVQYSQLDGGGKFDIFDTASAIGGLAKSINSDNPQIPVRVPSLVDSPSNDRLGSSRKGSHQSLESQNSGVASWNDESEVSKYAVAERELQRLSIINENGDHISSRRRRSIARPLDAQVGRRVTPRLERRGSITTIVMSEQTVQPVQLLQPVDSQRVYSALMKRLDDSNPAAELAKQSEEMIRTTGSFVGDEFQKQIRVPARTSSKPNLKELVKSESSTPATIRKVQWGGDDDDPWISPLKESQEQLLAGKAPFFQGKPVSSGNPSSEDDVFTNASRISILSFDKKGSARDRFGYKSAIVRQLSGPELLSLPKKRHDPDTGISVSNKHEVPGIFLDDDKENIDPLDVEFGGGPNITTTIGVVRDRSSKGLKEAGSGMFSSSHFMIERSTSPYKNALAREGMLGPQGTTYTPNSSRWQRQQHTVARADTPRSDSSETDQLRTPMATSQLQSRQHGSTCNSDSVYSRTTSGKTPVGSSTALSSKAASDDGTDMFPLPVRTLTNPGDAVIFKRRIYKPTRPKTEVAEKLEGHKQTGSNGSEEWRSWMANEVQSLERSQPQNLLVAPAIRKTALPIPRRSSFGSIDAAAIVKPALEEPKTKNIVAKDDSHGNSASSLHKRERAQIFSSEDAESFRTARTSPVLYSSRQSSLHSSGEAPTATHHRHLHVPPNQDQSTIRSILRGTTVEKLEEEVVLHTPSAEAPNPLLATVTTPLPIPIPPPPPPPLPSRSPLRQIRSKGSLSPFPSPASTPTKDALIARRLRLQKSSATLASKWSADSESVLDVGKASKNKLTKKINGSQSGSKGKMNNAETKGAIGHLLGSRFVRNSNSCGVLRAVEDSFTHSRTSNSSVGIPVSRRLGSSSGDRALDAKVLGTPVTTTRNQLENRSPSTDSIYGEAGAGLLGPRRAEVKMLKLSMPGSFNLSKDVGAGCDPDLPLQARGNGTNKDRGGVRSGVGGYGLQTGSMHMVDMFLSSRRRRIRGSEDSSGEVRGFA